MGKPPISPVKTAGKASPGREKKNSENFSDLFPKRVHTSERIIKAERAIKGKREGITERAHISRPFLTPSAAVSGIIIRSAPIKIHPITQGMYAKREAFSEFMIFN